MASSHRSKTTGTSPPAVAAAAAVQVGSSPQATTTASTINNTGVTMFKLLLFEPLFPTSDLDLADASHWKATNGNMGILVASDQVENLLGLPSMISEFQSLRFIEWLSVHLAQSQSFESWGVHRMFLYLHEGVAKAGVVLKK
ncbi:hypothetical protein V8E54_001775 [Elaphomyces granulatus]